MSLFFVQTYLLPDPTYSLTPLSHNQQCDTHLGDLVISRMLYKWVHIVCNLLGLFFVSFCFVLFRLLRRMMWRFSQMALCLNSVFLLSSEYHCRVWMCHSLLNLSPVKGCLSCQFLDITNTLNTPLQVFVLTSIFISLGLMPWNEMAALYVVYMLSVYKAAKFFSRERYHFTLPSTRNPVSVHSWQHVILSIFSNLHILRCK